MNKNIKVSIIIPVYNVEQYLRQCLESIIQQTFRDFECICINDCSTDNSRSILEEYAKKMTDLLSLTYRRTRDKEKQGTMA